MIVPDLAAYEELAVRLAENPRVFANLKAKIAEKRKTAPLFDSARWVRSFESGLQVAWSTFKDAGWQRPYEKPDLFCSDHSPSPTAFPGNVLPRSRAAVIHGARTPLMLSQQSHHSDAPDRSTHARSEVPLEVVSPASATTGNTPSKCEAIPGNKISNHMRDSVDQPHGDSSERRKSSGATNDRTVCVNDCVLRNKTVGNRVHARAAAKGKVQLQARVPDFRGASLEQQVDS
jgi:hypothetical protein